MAMKTISCNIAKAASALCVFSLTVSVTKAQEDRGERVQESISSSDQRTDFSARKAAPSKIDSAAFKDLVEKRKKCLRAKSNLENLEKKWSGKELSKGVQTEFDAARAELKKAEAAVKEAERKANAD
jgi:isopentenyl diphosphate isomerase/L-lactate dehydrogenase-like FMN-dependent dehydrogenase